MPDSRGYLRLVVRHGRERICYNVGYKVDRAKWNKDTQRCARNTTHGKKSVPAARINATIQLIEDFINERHYTTATTTEDIRADLGKFLGRQAEQNRKDFFPLFKEYIDTESVASNWGKGVRSHMQTLIHDWHTFRPSMTVEDINEDTLNAFRAYLVATGLQNETTQMKIKKSKWFFRWLVGKGVLSDMSFAAYRDKLKSSSRVVVFLTWDELMNVYAHRFSQPHLERVRDVFCFCCFTSLRYSDVHALRKVDIYDDAIHITTQKTNDALTIELNKYSRAILARYADDGREEALPVISNVKYNVYIKEVCRLCGIDEQLSEVYYVGAKKHEVTRPKWQMVSTHCGRRTFICNALMLGIPPNIVMKWTGHHDYNTMKPYIDIADKAKRSAMSVFDR